jgi:hypothetical protein
MSQQAIATIQCPPTSPDETQATARPATRSVGQVLGAMTYAERVRAYRNGVFTRSELAAAIAREPERLPTINGEYEWVAPALADNLD